MKKPLVPALLLLACTALAGCASSGKTFPSLQIRDAERVSGSFADDGQPLPIDQPAPLSNSIVEQIAQIADSAKSSHAAFQRAAPGASRIVTSSRNAAVASDSWAAAQVALGDLDSLRSQTAVALGDLDLMFVDATLAFEQREAIAQAREVVIAYVAEEDVTLERLRGALSN